LNIVEPGNWNPAFMADVAIGIYIYFLGIMEFHVMSISQIKWFRWGID
jgi:hypothetical protein